MIDPKSIVIAIPSYSSRVYALTFTGVCNVIGSGRCGNPPLMMLGGSNVGAVRNMIAHRFLQSPFEWLVMIDDDIGFTVQDWDYLLEDSNGERAVCADYLKKIDGRREVARLGLGFARVHRSVFDDILKLTREDGSPWVPQGIYSRELVYDFFPQGVTAAGEYRQEDHGFWTWVNMAGIQVRHEYRTRLRHFGGGTWEFDPALDGPSDGAQ
jgi:hypothetical protein